MDRGGEKKDGTADYADSADWKARSGVVEFTMIRACIASLLIAPTLIAQASEHRLKEAWTRYTQYDLLEEGGKGQESGLPPAMDELGRAWAAWLEGNGATPRSLPAPMAFLPSKEPDTLAPPANLILAYRAPWTLMGLKVPAPCGSHLFLALFKTHGAHWTLTMLGLHEPRNGGDPLGARENVHALLLDGPIVVIASTPPWCTSCWSVLHVCALSPGARADHPKLIAHFEDTIYRCADEDTLLMTPVIGGLRLRYEGTVGPDGAPALREKTLDLPGK